MIALKAPDVFYEPGGTSARFQVRMALCAIGVASGGKANGSPMIAVAGSAGGRECFRCVMQGAVMAGQAFLVDHFLIVKTQCGNMAGGALPGENRVRGGQISSGVHAAVTANPEPCHAQDGQHRRGNGKEKNPAA